MYTLESLLSKSTPRRWPAPAPPLSAGLSLCGVSASPLAANCSAGDPPRRSGDPSAGAAAWDGLPPPQMAQSTAPPLWCRSWSWSRSWSAHTAGPPWPGRPSAADGPLWAAATLPAPMFCGFAGRVALLQPLTAIGAAARRPALLHFLVGSSCRQVPAREHDLQCRPGGVQHFL